MMMMFGALFVDNESIIHCNGALLILDQAYQLAAFSSD